MNVYQLSIFNRQLGRWWEMGRGVVVEDRYENGNETVCLGGRRLGLGIPWDTILLLLQRSTTTQKCRTRIIVIVRLIPAGVFPEYSTPRCHALWRPR